MLPGKLSRAQAFWAGHLFFPPATAILWVAHRHTKSLQGARVFTLPRFPLGISNCEPHYFFQEIPTGEHTQSCRGKIMLVQPPAPSSSSTHPLQTGKGGRHSFGLDQHAQVVLWCRTWHLEVGGQSKARERHPGAFHTSRHGREGTCSLWSREQPVRAGTQLSRRKNLGQPHPQLNPRSLQCPQYCFWQMFPPESPGLDPRRDGNVFPLDFVL